MYGQYSISNIMRIYNNKKDLITKSYNEISNTDGSDIANEWKTLLSTFITLIIVMIILTIALYVWAITYLVKNWEKMNIWIAILAAVVLFVPSLGPIVSLIIVFIATRGLKK